MIQDRVYQFVHKRLLDSLRGHAVPDLYQKVLRVPKTHCVIVSPELFWNDSNGNCMAHQLQAFGNPA